MPTYTVRRNCSTVNVFSSAINCFIVLLKRGRRLSQLTYAISGPIRRSTGSRRNSRARSGAAPIVRCGMAKASSRCVTGRGRSSRYRVFVFIGCNNSGVYSSHASIVIRRGTRACTARNNASSANRRVLSKARR